MEHEVKKYIEEIDNYIADFIPKFTVSDIMNMDEEGYKGIKAAMKLLNSSKELILNQAKVIDDQTRKLDLILTKLEELSKKTEP